MIPVDIFEVKPRDIFDVLIILLVLNTFDVLNMLELFITLEVLTIFELLNIL